LKPAEKIAVVFSSIGTDGGIPRAVELKSVGSVVFVSQPSGTSQGVLNGYQVPEFGFWA
jgi:hypothetical protein